MKMRNLFKEKIKAQGYALGAVLASCSAANAEVFGLNGYDFIMIDMEHVQTDTETVVDCCRAGEIYGMPSLVRVYDRDDGPMMARLLDVGLHGIMVPMVDTPEQAKFVVDNVKIAPMGKRGMGGGRGPRWGAYGEYNLGEANDNLFTVMQCETAEAIKNVYEICATPGLDCLYIGTSDLSKDLGCYPRFEDPMMLAAIDAVLDACHKNGVIPGIVTVDPQDSIRRVKQGFRFMTILNDMNFFYTQTKKRIGEVRAGLK